MAGKPYRLLTEAEWEYAARGVTSADAPHPPYPWGDQASHEYANYGTDQCCNGRVEGRDQWFYTAPIGKFPPNDFALHDMHGNVWEWVEDPDDYRGAPINGTAWTEGGDIRRVVRGGFWGSDPEGLRSAVRARVASDVRDSRIGSGSAGRFPPESLLLYLLGSRAKPLVESSEGHGSMADNSKRTGPAVEAHYEFLT